MPLNPNLMILGKINSVHGEYDLRSKAVEFDEDGKAKLFQMYDGPNHTAETDWDGMKAYQSPHHKRVPSIWKILSSPLGLNF